MHKRQPLSCSGCSPSAPTSWENLKSPLQNLSLPLQVQPQAHWWLPRAPQSASDLPGLGPCTLSGSNAVMWNPDVPGPPQEPKVKIWGLILHLDTAGQRQSLLAPGNPLFQQKTPQEENRMGNLRPPGSRLPNSSRGPPPRQGPVTNTTSQKHPVGGPRHPCVFPSRRESDCWRKGQSGMTGKEAYHVPRSRHMSCLLLLLVLKARPHVTA